MIVFLIALGIFVGLILTVALPWALLRKLESKDQGEEDD